jgi:hypothetical protein
MRKTLIAGFFSTVLGVLVVGVAFGHGMVNADAFVDPSAELFRILLWMGGALVAMGIVLIASASLLLRK